MSEFRMPSLGADMTEGTLLEWFVKPGDTVHRGDIVALVDTSKAEIEIEIFEDGVVEAVLVDVGERVPVGTALATIASAAGAPTPEPEPAPAPEAAPAPRAVPAPMPIAVASTATATTERRLRVSPVARRVAEHFHVDLERVHGTGPGGAITKADVEQALTGHNGNGATPTVAPAAEAPAPPPPPGGDRRAAAAEATAVLMARSKREIPHFYLGLDIDLSPAMSWLEETNSQRSIHDRLLPAALLTKAVARSAAEVPELNGFWERGGFHPGNDVNVGVAVSLRGGGIVAPAIRRAPELSLDELMEALRDLVKRTREGRLRSGEMSSGTITITNLGDRGVDYVQGVIYPPQVALVGFGRVREVPWAVDGMVGVRPIVSTTLAADHRVSEGHRGSLFLSTIDRLLQKPEEL